MKTLIYCAVALAILAAGFLYLVASAPAEQESYVAPATITFDYPEKLPATYMHAMHWPPQATLIEEPFTCTEAGDESVRAGKTEKRIINGRTYCVTTIVEGAAGSVYTQYAYLFPVGEATIALTFTVQAAQCGNYDEPEKVQCEEERASFAMDSFIDDIATTLTLSQ